MAMKTNAFVLLCALTLFAAAPTYAQFRGSVQSDKQGHNNNGPDKHDRRDYRNEQAANYYSLLQTHMADVVSSLSIGKLATPAGAPVPFSAQTKLYFVLTSVTTASNAPNRFGSLLSSTQNLTRADSTDAAVRQARLFAALAGAGIAADTTLRTLVQSLSGFAFDSRRVADVVVNFNDFVEAASPAFLAKPPAEFVALHTVLGKLIAGLPKQRITGSWQVVTTP
jgi:hypothetical protein